MKSDQRNPRSGRLSTEIAAELRQQWPRRAFWWSTPSLTGCFTWKCGWEGRRMFPFSRPCPWCGGRWLGIVVRVGK